MTVLDSQQRGPRPASGIPSAGAYSVPGPTAPVDLWLGGNEGRPSSPATLSLSLDELARYPSYGVVETRLGDRHGVAPDRVLITAGADDGILRAALAFLEPGRRLLLPSPTFEMIPRYARLAGGDVIRVPWRGGSYPVEDVLTKAKSGADVVAVVSPNNPTGAIATTSDLERLGRELPDALLLVDLAYAEFADEDLTRAALELPNAVVLRTFSKAYGLAGLRVGYALGSEAVIACLRAAGNPYPVSSSSLAAIAGRLSTSAGIDGYVAQVRAERSQLREILARLGAYAEPSQGNFVLARFDDALLVRDLLAGLGIGVRAFPEDPELSDALRITCPGDSRDFERLARALQAVLAPESLLLDVDGVLADVSRSYRSAIVATAHSFGVEVTTADIRRAKAEGNANDDWALTRALLGERGVEASLVEVRARFETVYQGTLGAPGLRRFESLIPAPDLLERLATRRSVAAVTGRPRADAARFLADTSIEAHFGAVVAREDAALKPDPAPVRMALERLGTSSAWMVGDTPDDVRAARAAGVVPIGVLAPGDQDATALLAAGAARVLSSIDELEELLP